MEPYIVVSFGKGKDYKFPVPPSAIGSQVGNPFPACVRRPGGTGIPPYFALAPAPSSSSPATCSAMASDAVRPGDSIP